jgi:hypothetical protein
MGGDEVTDSWGLDLTDSNQGTPWGGDVVTDSWGLDLSNSDSLDGGTPGESIPGGIPGTVPDPSSDPADAGATKGDMTNPDAIFGAKVAVNAALAAGAVAGGLMAVTASAMGRSAAAEGATEAAAGFGFASDIGWAISVICAGLQGIAGNEPGAGPDKGK